MTQSPLLLTKSERPKLLVTGASGFLGSRVVQVAQQQWQVVGVYQHRCLPQAGVTWVPCNLAEPQQVRELWQQVQPQAVLHLAAQSNTTQCQNQPSETEGINVRATGAIAQCCAEQGIALVFTSTDLVFDGQAPPYREGDAINPLNAYGQQKAKAEALVLRHWPQAIVARMPLLFGLGGVGPRNFMQQIVEALVQQTPVNLFEDEIRTPVSRETAVRGLLAAVDWATTGRHHGLLHLGGRERLSRYDLGQQMAAVLGCSAAVLQACRQADVVLPAPRPGDVSLDSAIAWGLGYAVPSLLEQLQREAGQGLQRVER